MPGLKKQLILSSLVLFIIICVNIAGYFYSSAIEARFSDAEKGYAISSNQQFLIQQLSRKISVLSVHHYFSAEQYSQQKKEAGDLIEDIGNQHLVLQQLIDQQAPNWHSIMLANFKKSDIALAGLRSIADGKMKEVNGKREDDPILQTRLKANENDYVSSMKSIRLGFRMIEKKLENTAGEIKNLMITSLFISLVILIVILIVPVIRLNSKTFKELQASLREVQKAEQAIKDSEKKYRHLFQSNPMPMYVFDPETLKFLEVNESAVRHYGYSKEEFLTMTILDIRPQSEQERMKAILPKLKQEEELHLLDKWIHNKKSGEEIVVEMSTHRIEYNDKEALLVLANDVTKNIQLQQELLNEKVNHQREIAKAALSVQEKERNEIGKELHDNVNQILTSVKLHLELIDTFGKEKHLPKSIHLVEDVINEIRRLSKSLVPPMFNDMGLLNAIEDLVENMNSFQSFSLAFTSSNFAEDRYENDFKLTLFRIVQEQITNIVKHAEAQQAEIVLEQTNSHIGLVIKDNGKGFNKTQKRKGIGLTNIINRADVYNGMVSIDTAPGEGCSLSIYFPIQEVEIV